MQWEQLEQQAAAAARELLQKAHVPHGGIVVVGCSTSEIMGGSIGKASSMAAAGAVYRGLAPVRLSVRRLGQANLVAARTRPKFIGGARAAYLPEEELR